MESGERALLFRAQMLNATERSESVVALPYEDIVRLSCLLGYHEGAYDELHVLDAIRWWRRLGDCLKTREGWQFSIRDLEPSWMRWEVQGDFTVVHVDVDDDGGLCYGVTATVAGEPVSDRYATLEELEAALQ
ncbi:hypothetical protein POF50_019045 [Streptomyces sp. SL13]|uniref:Uncharacterized protein n=1 Tax=Streptantibioticus silvisoli TaxID=2705255 RepID=A0AA90HAZ7_9ACTN|nr:hypothetical protein [Streptantibioticus silvisoli]MDI5971407.1 hypothetical protein [Streptantibioticus silvisoli]